MSPDELMVAAKKAGLDGVCITEHNKVWHAEDAAALSEKHGLTVLRGMEVTTTGGDILVFGLHEEPNGILTPTALMKRVEAAGGVAVAAHLFRGFLLCGFGSLSMRVEDAVENPTFAHVHGLEVCNGRVTPEENAFARKVAQVMGLLAIGGSDAHEPESVGRCAMKFKDRIENEQQLVAALLNERCRVDR
jgi:predicted metal-dependent phosphoesterase TrpH